MPSLTARTSLVQSSALHGFNFLQFAGVSVRIYVLRAVYNNNKIIIIIKYLYSASILKVQKRLTRATQL